MNTSESIIAELKTKGFRITKPRAAILSLLANSDMPLSVPEMLKEIKTSIPSVNKTTVYRELEFLHDQRIIHEVDLLEGLKRYELIQADSHHHHAVCTRCRSIRCIEMTSDLDSLEQKIKRNHGFLVTSHSLEFFGLCEKCQKVESF